MVVENVINKLLNCDATPYTANLIVREVRLYEALSQMDELRKSVEMHPNRKKFWEGVKRGENIDTLYGYVQKNFVQKIISLIRYMGIRLKYKLIKTQ